MATLVLATAVQQKTMAEDPAPTAKLGDFAGWYAGEGDYRLTVLPGEKVYTAVFFWRKTSPTSVGTLVETEDGGVAFKQPAATDSLEVERKGERVRSVTLTELKLKYRKQCDATKIIGEYKSAKTPTLSITEKDNQLYCSIDWKNGAPNSNGYIHAGANGQTVLEGYKWQQPLEIEFDGNSIKSISMLDQKFRRLRDKAN